MNSNAIPKFLGKGKDISGQRFGRLVAVEPVAERGKSRQLIWKCFCDCGELRFVRSSNLVNGTAKSCGCLFREQTSKRSAVHGKCNTSAYSSWKSIIQRCENPKAPNYKYYGGKRIKICERWRNSFEAFYEDMGPRPEGMSIDRWPDNDGNYEPGNCRWATKKEQSNNCKSISYGPSPQRWFYGYGPNGEMIVENNQSYIARVFGLNQGMISACLRNKRKHHRSWKFQWIEGCKND